MSVLFHLQNNLPNLSKNERRIAEYILHHPKEVQKLSGDAISAICNASRSTVLRLCQKLGYQGYSEFKFSLSHDLEASPHIVSPKPEFPSQPPINALTYYCNGFLLMEPLVDSPSVTELVDTLSYANRVVALGIFHSEFSAKQMAFRLNKFGIDCLPIGDTTIMSSYERILKQGDIAIIFSISGRDSYESTIMEYRKNRVKIVLITMNPDCKLVKLADLTITLPDFANTSDLYPMDEAVIFFMFIEIVMEALNKKLLNME